MKQEPFGYFKAEPFGWTDCAPTDEGAIALYEHPAQQPDDARDALRNLVTAVEAELSDDWACNSYHPLLRPALKAAQAAMATPDEMGGV